jgi:hypothetical protein
LATKTSLIVFCWILHVPLHASFLTTYRAGHFGNSPVQNSNKNGLLSWGDMTSGATISWRALAPTFRFSRPSEQTEILINLDKGAESAVSVRCKSHFENARNWGVLPDYLQQVSTKGENCIANYVREIASKRRARSKNGINKQDMTWQANSVM